MEKLSIWSFPTRVVFGPGAARETGAEARRLGVKKALVVTDKGGVTAGTGSEVGRSGVVTLDANHRKTVIFSPFLMPTAALLDPELTATMPARTTAATGFDALTHCLEAYVALGDHPMADAIALGGLGLVAAN